MPLDLEERLDEYKARYRRAALPDDVRQNYEGLLAFVDAGMDPGRVTDFTGELAGQLECKLDVFFPVADQEAEINPEKLVSQQHYDTLREALRHYERLEGDVTEAILEHVPGEGDETLCVFPAPFQLTPDEQPDPGVIGDVIETLIGQFLHPTLLLRDPPHLPSGDLFDHVVVAGSTLHNLLRLVRCTAGLCPVGTQLSVIAVADERFMASMRQLLEESEEFDLEKTEARLRETLLAGMRRQLDHLRRRLLEEHDLGLEFEIHEGTVQEAARESERFQEEPTLLALPLHFTGGGYDTAALRPLFKRYPSAEILTI